jgi:hypothetical protein
VATFLCICDHFCRYGQAHAHSKWHHVKSLVARNVLLMKRNMLFVYGRMFSALAVALIYGFMYWQKGIEEGLPRYGMWQNVLMNLAFCNMRELATGMHVRESCGPHPWRWRHTTWGSCSVGALVCP